jgi:NAD-specific glutamate dehydrogenase
MARTAGVPLATVCRAAAIAWRLARGGDVVTAVRAAYMSSPDEVATMLVVEDVLARTTRWVLARPADARSLGDVARDLGDAIEPARGRLAAWLVDAEAETLHRRRAALEVAGVAPAAAGELAAAEWLPSLLDVATLARDDRLDLEEVARRYYGLATEIDFAWLDAELAGANERDPWAQRALDGVADDVRTARRRLARDAGAGDRACVEPVRRLLAELKSTGRATLPALVVIGREIRRLSGGLE